VPFRLAFSRYGRASAGARDAPGHDPAFLSTDSCAFAGFGCRIGVGGRAFRSAIFGIYGRVTVRDFVAVAPFGPVRVRLLVHVLVEASYAPTCVRLAVLPFGPVTLFDLLKPFSVIVRE
jgi:hypothetical protein